MVNYFATKTVSELAEIAAGYETRAALALAGRASNDVGSANSVAGMVAHAVTMRITELRTISPDSYRYDLTKLETAAGNLDWALSVFAPIVAAY